MKTISSLVRGVLAVATVGLATTFAPVAQADNLTITGWAVGNGYDFGFGVSAPVPTNSTTYAGGFEGNWSAQDVILWCIELNQFFNWGTYGDYVASPEVGSTLLGKLFTRAYGDQTDQALSDAAHSAAFQLAIWEIWYDPTSLNLSSGLFKVAGGPSSSISIAQGWLDGLEAFSDEWHLFFLKSPSAQDFAVAGYRSNSVPEPGGLALVALAMLAMLGVRRMRPRSLAN